MSIDMGLSIVHWVYQSYKNLHSSSQKQHYIRHFMCDVKSEISSQLDFAR